MNNNSANDRTNARLAAERRTKRNQSFVRTFEKNPFLASAAGVCIIAGAGVSLSNALVLCAVVLVLLPLLCIFASLENKRLSDDIRPMVYFLASSVLVFGISFALNTLYPGCVEPAGIFVPLLSASSIAMCSTSLERKGISSGEAFLEGLAVALCFCLVALPVSIVREVIGSGKILGFELGFNGVELITSPGFGFILCGIMLAVFNALRDAAAPRERGVRR